MIPHVTDVLPLAAGSIDTRMDQLSQWLISLDHRSKDELAREKGRKGARSTPGRYGLLIDRFFAILADMTGDQKIRFGHVDAAAQKVYVLTEHGEIPIDQVSQGRFLFGIGGGWNQDEMEDHGTVYATRFKRMHESIEAMKEIWTKEKAEYHGEFVNFDPMIARPKPVQKPHPPIHVGGAFPHGARRAIRYGDGWIPTARGDVTEVLPKFREMAREAGRDPASIEITSFGLGEDPDRVKRLAEVGVARVVPMFPPEKPDTVLPIVDRWTKIMRQVNG